MSEEIDDFVDACDVDFNEDPTSDDDLDYIVLFPNGKDEKLEAEYKELFEN